MTNYQPLPPGPTRADAHNLEAWSKLPWAHSAPDVRDDFDIERDRFDVVRDSKHGVRARLFRPLRGGRNLAYPERANDKAKTVLTFSSDGRSTYARSLETVQLGDLLHAHPLRDFSRRRGQTNKPVAVHTQTTGDLVPCESRLERQLVILADFDQRVTHIAAQPFTMEFPSDGTLSRHTPDFVLLGSNRVPLAVDVKTPAAAEDPRTLARHRDVHAALSHAGIAHIVWTGLPDVMTSNLALFSKSRVDRNTQTRYEEALLRAAKHPRTVAEVVADLPQDGLAAAEGLVVVRRLIWLHRLLVDLGALYSPRSMVVSA